MRFIRLSFYIVVLFLGFHTSAQTLNSLFPKEAQSPGVSIPFEVESTKQISVKQVVFDTNNSECKALVDPHAEQILHIRCNGEGELQFRTFFTEDGVLKSISSPVLNIAYPAGGTPVVPTPDPNNPDVEFGRSVYHSNCTRCHEHSSPPEKKLHGRTEQQIRSSLSSVRSMKDEFAAMGKTFSNEEIKALSAYLGSFK